MPQTTSVLAVDLGASGGRVMRVTLAAGRLALEELHRFEHTAQQRDGLLCWDHAYLLTEIKRGILAAGGGFASVAVDTWGVDFALVGADGALLSPFVSYRDGRTNGMAREIFNVIPEAELYRRTGCQMMEINTLFQLAALRKQNPALFGQQASLLMAADYFNYMLSGKMAAEASMASTSQLLSPYTRDWDWDLLDRLGFPKDWFLPVIAPGTVLGNLKDEFLAARCDCIPKVICTAGHDTACAAFAAPMEDETALFLSCGTWSLLGAELDAPVFIEGAARRLTNELGVGKITFMSNMTGLWIVQEARRRMRERGNDLSYAQLERMAAECPAFACFIDPAAELFQAPGDMLLRVRQFCAQTGQAVPETDAQALRCVYDSLAMQYRRAAEEIARARSKDFTVLHMVGGGSQSALLCSLTADVTRRRVLAGPAEATAIGNGAVQLLALGCFEDARQARQAIRESFGVTEYLPCEGEQAKVIEEAYEKFLRVC